MAGEIDLVKSRTVSDRGAGVERMIGDVDRRPGDVEREDREWRENLRRKFHAAETKLRRLRLSYLVPTLALICKNGKNREESQVGGTSAGKRRKRDISHIAKKLKKSFSANKHKGPAMDGKA